MDPDFALHAQLLPEFSLPARSQMEINIADGLHQTIAELSDARGRIRHISRCNKLYLITLLSGDDAEARRDETQKFLSWPEGYHVKHCDGATSLQFIEAVEQCDYAMSQQEEFKQ